MWITWRKSGLQEGKRATFHLEWEAPPATQPCKLTASSVDLLPAPRSASCTQARRWAALGRIPPPTPRLQPSHQPAPASELPRAPGSSARPLIGPGAPSVAVVTVGSRLLSPHPHPPAPSRTQPESGQRWRERAARPLLERAARQWALGAASAAPVAPSASLGSAPLDPEPARAGLPSPPPLPPPRGQLL